MSQLTEIIGQRGPSLQELVEKIKNAPSLAMMILAAIQLGRAVAVKVVEEILNERGQAPTTWPLCSECGSKLESKGRESREVLTLVGLIKWWRRRGGCPKGCEIGQVIPLDKELGLSAYQKTSLEVKWLACGLAVFVPFECAAVLLAMLTGVKVSGKSIWVWVQGFGHMAMTQLESQLQALAEGILPTQEAMTAATKTLPLLIGADGAMVPFRPVAGTPAGKTKWREVKVAILARLGHRITKAGQQIPCLSQRRLVAVLGNIDALSPRLWLEATRQGILSSPRVVWLADGGVGFWRLFEERFAQYAVGILDFYHAACGKEPKSGLMDEPNAPATGLSPLADACAGVKLTKSWLTLRLPWPWRGCPLRLIRA